VRVVVTRVSSARVRVDGATVSEIGPGLLALVGVTHTDSAATADTMAGKIYNLRILHDEKSAAELGAPVLIVSQFTLYADTRKGRRPSWLAAAPGPVAEPLIEELCDALRRRGAHVETGVFGAHMDVESVNDGPVTVILDLGQHT
jgi:D-tyrosyl-tRNA(Tyr) deacylase